MKRKIADIKIRPDRMRSVIDLDGKGMLELAESIKATGLIHPITIDPEGFLVAGERRLVASQLAGLEEVDVNVNDGDPLVIELEENTKRLDLPWPDRARAEVKVYDHMMRKDPKWSSVRQALLMKKSDWTIRNFLRLGRALATRPHLEAVGSTAEALRLLAQEEEREERGERGAPMHLVHAPEWARDRYVLGDAFVGMEEFVASQPHQRGVACHLAFVDPPTRQGPYDLPTRHTWDDFDGLYKRVSDLVYHCMVPNAFGLFWFEMEEHQTVLSILRSSGWLVSPTPGIWVKHQVSATPKPDALLGTCFHPFLVARKGKPRLGRPGRGNVFNYPEANLIAHSEKPYRLCEEIVRTFLFPKSRVIIPFLGSGNMLRACTAADHYAFGWDIGDDYKDRFLKRVEEDRVLHADKQRKLAWSTASS